MADHSVLRGGAGSPVRRDDREPEVEIIDAIAGQPGDGQARRYAHTTRRGGATSTPPSGVSTAAIAQAGQREISTIEMPRLSPADPRDAAKLAVSRLASADPRDSAKLAVPRLPADPHDSANVTMPKMSSADPRDSAKIALPRPEVDDPRDSAKIALPRPEVDDPRDSAKIALPRPEVDAPRDSAKIASPRPSRPTTAPPVAARAGTETAHPVRAPNDSTALYRKPNTRPTLPTVQADGTPRRDAPIGSDDDAPSAMLVDEISIPEPIGADAPSRLPSVMLDADPGRMALLRVPSLPSLPNLPGLPGLSRVRLALPIAVVAVAIAVWLLRSML